MTDRKTEEAVKFARASLALDGLTPSPEAEAKVRAQLDTYRGETYRAASGQWAWVIYQNDEDYCRGAGYPDEEEAAGTVRSTHGLRLLPAGRPRRWRGAARPLPS